MTITQETITPKMAQEYLKCNVANYRSISRQRVMSYSNDMLNGSWQSNGEAIKFDEQGNLLDGQHRLHAIVKAGVPVNMIVIRGLGQETNIFDIGMGRSLGQIAQASGFTNGRIHVIAAMANAICSNFNNNTLYGRGQVLKYMQDHADDLTLALNVTVHGASSPICKKASIAVASYVCIRNGMPANGIGDFFRIANTGIPQGHWEPSSALIYRNMVQTQKGHNQEERRILYSGAVSALNDFMAGKPRVLKYKFDLKSMELLHKVRLEDGLCKK